MKGIDPFGFGIPSSLCDQSSWCWRNGWFGFCSQGGMSCYWIGLWCNASDLMVEPSSIHTRVFLFLCNVVAPFKPDHCARRIVAMVLSSCSKLLLKHEAFSKQAWPSNNKLSFSFCVSSSQPHTATKSSSRSENSAALTFGYSGW